MPKVVCLKASTVRNNETGFCIEYNVYVSDGTGEMWGGNFDVCLTGEENIVAVNNQIVAAGRAWGAANGLVVADKDIWYDALSRG